MKTKTIKKLMTFGLVILVSSLSLFNQASLAVSKDIRANKANQAQMKAARNEKTNAVNTVEKYHLQVIKDGPLELQFRYVHKTLTELGLKNISDKTISISIMRQNYVLGPGDAVTIDSPKVKSITVKHTAYTHHFTTPIGHLLPNRFTTTSIYKLPPNTENKTAPPAG